MRSWYRVLLSANYFFINNWKQAFKLWTLDLTPTGIRSANCVCPWTILYGCWFWFVCLAESGFVFLTYCYFKVHSNVRVAEAIRSKQLITKSVDHANSGFLKNNQHFEKTTNALGLKQCIPGKESTLGWIGNRGSSVLRIVEYKRNCWFFTLKTWGAQPRAFWKNQRFRVYSTT